MDAKSTTKYIYICSTVSTAYSMKSLCTAIDLGIGLGMQFSGFSKRKGTLERNIYCIPLTFNNSKKAFFYPKNPKKNVISIFLKKKQFLMDI